MMTKFYGTKWRDLNHNELIAISYSNSNIFIGVTIYGTGSTKPTNKTQKTNIGKLPYKLPRLITITPFVILSVRRI